KVSLPDGKVSEFGSVPPPPPNAGLVTGIALDRAGNVYVAAGSLVDASVFLPGIYKIPPSGGPGQLFAKDPRFPVLNGLVFDKHDNLFITDSGKGVVFMVTPTGEVEQWVADPLLLGDTQNPCAAGLGFPIGANGIAISGSSMIVANTDRAS